MPNVIRGCNEMVQQNGDLFYVRGEGVRDIYKWEGPADQAKPKFFALLQTGLYDTITTLRDSNGVVYGLQAVAFGTPQDATSAFEVIWEVLPSPFEEDIFQHAVFDSLSDSTIRLMKNHLDNPEESTAPNLTADSDEEKMYKLILRGVTSTKDHAPVIQKTTVVGNQYDQDVAYTNVRRIIPNDSIRAAENIPSDFRIPFTDSAGLPDTKDGFTIGWYKQPPTTRRRSRGTYDIVQQWEFGIWNTDVQYQLYTP